MCSGEAVATHTHTHAGALADTHTTHRTKAGTHRQECWPAGLRGAHVLCCPVCLCVQVRFGDQGEELLHTRVVVVQMKHTRSFRYAVQRLDPTRQDVCVCVCVCVCVFLHTQEFEATISADPSFWGGYWGVAACSKQALWMTEDHETANKALQGLDSKVCVCVCVCVFICSLQSIHWWNKCTSACVCFCVHAPGSGIRGVCST